MIDNTDFDHYRNILVFVEGKDTLGILREQGEMYAKMYLLDSLMENRPSICYSDAIDIANSAYEILVCRLPTKTQ
jgi:hypothetical protein